MFQIGSSYFFCFLIFGIMVPLLSPVLLQLGFSKTQVGFIQAGIYLTSVAVPILGGRISDRFYSQEGLIRVTAALMTLASLALAFAQSQPGWLFVLALLILCAARAPQVPLQDALAMQVAGSHPGRFAKMRQAGSFGFALAAICMGYLTQHYGLSVFFTALVIAACLYQINSLYLPKEKKLAAAQSKLPFWGTLNRTWWFWLLALFFHWLSFAPYHYGFTILLTEAHVPLTLSGWLWAAGVGAEIVFFLISGRFFDALGFRGVLITAFIANLIRWLLIGLFPIGWVIGLTQILHGPGFALYYAAVLQGIHFYCGGHQRASYQGLYTTMVAGGSSILGMLLAGKLYEMMPFSRVFLWMVPLQFLGLIFLTMNRLQPPQRRD